MSTISSLTTSTSPYSRIRMLRSFPQQTRAKRRLVHLLTLRNSSPFLLQAFPARQGHCKNISLFHPRGYGVMQNRTLKIQRCWDHRAGVANTTFGVVSSETNGKRCTLLFKYRYNILQIIPTRTSPHILRSILVSRMSSPSRSCLPWGDRLQGYPSRQASKGDNESRKNLTQIRSMETYQFDGFDGDIKRFWAGFRFSYLDPPCHKTASNVPMTFSWQATR